MITPNKYLNLDLSVINVSALIIQHLQKNKLMKYDELLYLVISQLGEKTKEIFPYALNFLYLLDKIIYHDGELDTFELK